MQPSALRVFGIETVWRRRKPRAAPEPIQAPPVLRMIGPWLSSDQAPAVVHAMLHCLQLRPSVQVIWEQGPIGSLAGRPVDSGVSAVLCFGEQAQQSDPVGLFAMLPAADRLRGAEVRRAAWEVLGQLKQSLRVRGLVQPD